jgi:hypothetical protein
MPDPRGDRGTARLAFRLQVDPRRGGASETTRTNAAELARIEAAIHQLWDEGCPVAHDAPATARVALRRWYSVERRHKSTPSREARINDVADGLIEAFEHEPRLVGPLRKDYLCVAEAVAVTVEQTDVPPREDDNAR